jgi:AcrR family transcriptional regulator
MSKLRAHPPTVKGNSASPFKSRHERAGEHEDKRMAVLRTAAELFVTQGFHGTKLSDVADRLHITKPAIYYYFESKDEILLACTRMALEASEKQFSEISREPLGSRERLERFLVWYAESMTTPFGKCLVRVAEQDVSPETQKGLIAAKRTIYRRLLQLVEAGLHDGSLAPCDPKVAAFTVAGALSWLSHWHKPGGKLSARDAAERVTQLLMHGLLPVKASSSTR